MLTPEKKVHIGDKAPPFMQQSADSKFNASIYPRGAPKEISVASHLAKMREKPALGRAKTPKMIAVEVPKNLARAPKNIERVPHNEHTVSGGLKQDFFSLLRYAKGLHSRLALPARLSLSQVYGSLLSKVSRSNPSEQAKELKQLQKDIQLCRKGIKGELPQRQKLLERQLTLEVKANQVHSQLKRDETLKAITGDKRQLEQFRKQITKVEEEIKQITKVGEELKRQIHKLEQPEHRLKGAKAFGRFHGIEFTARKGQSKNKTGSSVHRFIIPNDIRSAQLQFRTQEKMAFLDPRREPFEPFVSKEGSASSSSATYYNPFSRLPAPKPAGVAKPVEVIAQSPRSPINPKAPGFPNPLSPGMKKVVNIDPKDLYNPFRAEDHEVPAGPAKPAEVKVPAEPVKVSNTAITHNSVLEFFMSLSSRGRKGR